MSAAAAQLGRMLIPALTSLGRLKSSEALAGAKSAKEQAGAISKELFGYDFVGLVVKLFVYFAVAYVFAKFMEAIIYGTGWLNEVIKFLRGGNPLQAIFAQTINNVVSYFTFGLVNNVISPVPADPTNTRDYFKVPKFLTDLFTSGLTYTYRSADGGYVVKNTGVVYWDIVKGVAIGLVVWEGYNYYESNKRAGFQPSPLTLGVFGILLSALTLTTVPDIVQKIQDMNLFTGGGGQSSGHGAGV